MNRSHGSFQGVLQLAAPAAVAMAVLSPAVRGQCTANELTKLTASDGVAGDDFAWSVSISGDTAIVGAHRSNEAGINSGSASIFRRDFGGPNNWGEVVELVGFLRVHNPRARSLVLRTGLKRCSLKRKHR